MKENGVNPKDYIKVCIIDDDVLYRDSIKNIILKDSRIRIYGEYSSAIPFISQLNNPFLPDVCLIDIVLPEMSGVECGRLIKAKKSDIHIILMTAYPSPESLAAAKQINADYIQKGTVGEVLMDKIITNINSKREHFLSISRSEEKYNKAAMKVIKQFDDMQKNLSKLSKSQKEVLKLRKENKSINEIAQILEMTAGTVATHLNRGLKKLEIPNLLEYLDMED